MNQCRQYNKKNAFHFFPLNNQNESISSHIYRRCLPQSVQLIVEQTGDRDIKQYEQKYIFKVYPL